METISAIAKPSAAPANRALEEAAQELEALFLAEMLKSAGFGDPPESMNGGPGEEQFASFLRQEHARALAASGGIGLAEQIVASLASGRGANADG